MQPAPKVSVVTTVHNGEAFAERAPPSVLKQNYSDFEWIIVDDGSTDGTAKMLRELAKADTRVQARFSGRVGFVRALNDAISHARGEYIVRQDFDDVSFPNRIGFQVNFLDSHPKVGLVGGYYVVRGPRRGERYVRKPPTCHEMIVRSMARHIPFAHSVVTFRKKAWLQAGGYPELDDIEDLALWIAFVKLGWELANLSEVLGEHWVHAESYWHSHFPYHVRQRKLAATQARAVRELGLPSWMLVYPAARSLYASLPYRLRKIIRRTIGQSKETDLVATSEGDDTKVTRA